MLVKKWTLKMRNKEYLGDGVYACTDQYGIILTTEDGISVTNEIYLEPDVVISLLRYVDLVKKKDELKDPFP